MAKVAIQELDWDWRFFHIRPTLWTLPHRITASSALSPTICVEFPSTTTLSSKIGSTTSSRQKRGIENLPERQGAVVNNGGEYIID
jgi:hypothetical protein